MNYKLIIVFSLILYCLNSEALLFYISPGPEICSVNGTVLRPCYSLQQLSEDKTLLSNKTHLSLLFLSGIHVLPEYHTLTVFNIRNLEIHPWIEQQVAVMECNFQASLEYEDIGALSIFSMYFTSCTARHIYRNESEILSTVDIVNCVFSYSGSKPNSSNNNIIIKNHVFRHKVNISISKSTFNESIGAISCNSGFSFSNSDLFITNTQFLKCWSEGRGGALYIDHVDLKVQECLFVNNTATSGGAIYSSFSSVSIINTHFQNNKVTKTGSAISSFYSDLNVYNCWFLKNSALSGGAIYATQASYHSVVIINNTVFQENFATESGSAIYSDFLELDISNSLFKNNTALDLGGAIYSHPTKELYLSNNIFQDNFANRSGGAMYSESAEIDNCQFVNNSAGISGGAIHFDAFALDPFNNIINSTFKYNQAGHYGGAIYCEYSTTLSLIRGFSKSNYAENGGYLYSLDCRVSIEDEYYISNKAINGGAIYANNSYTSLRTVTIINNTAEENGGAIYLENSNIVTHYATFSHNTVTSVDGKGGAIFVLDSECLPKPQHNCFIGGITDTNLSFINNRATYGSVLYGGMLNWCSLTGSHLSGIDYFKSISQYYKQTSLAISSGPVVLCLCTKSFQADCNKRELTMTKRRGEVVNLLIVSLDQDKNSLVSTVNAHYKEHESAQLDKGEGRKQIPNKCSSVHYHTFSASDSATLILEPDGVCEHSPLAKLTVHIKLVPCTRGFEQKNGTCDCERRLTKFDISVCDTDTLEVHKKGSIWLRYDKDYLQIHTSCPLDYCEVSSETISLLYPDKQCANHRSGVICGACQDNHSIAFGGSKCLRCTTSYTSIWLTLVFAVAGVALVALLLVCNMTISNGMLNGLIFYANVISISGVTGLQNCSIHPILSVFIAWMNLDFGVATCFYSGMDTYQKTWLQFAFPLYIWVLVLVIIVASYYSSRAMKTFSRNNIAILATLFLLSYSKILKTIITALTFTQVWRGSADNVSSLLVSYKVWAYDGNIEYLKGKHATLFTVALLFLLFAFLPYTLLLTSGQYVRSMSVKRKYRCILRVIRSTAFISIMDAYHAPYNRKHRYWTGLTLLIRCALFLAFATSYRDNDIMANMYITTLIIFGILILKTFSTTVYVKFWVSVLELSFLVNLEVLSATLYYLKGSSNSNTTLCKISNASISISFITFLFILAYHTYLQIQNRRCFIYIKHTFLHKFPIRQYQQRVPGGDGSEVNLKPTDNTKKLPTTTLVELREELLASSDNH